MKSIECDAQLLSTDTKTLQKPIIYTYYKNSDDCNWFQCVHSIKLLYRVVFS